MEAFFQDVNQLIAYLYTKEKTIPPLKLQKALYFLYCYYIKFYANNSEIKYDFPDELFQAEFEARNYGSLIKSVYQERKIGEEKFQKLAHNFKEDKFFNGKYNEIKLFIDDLFKQIMQTSDFMLVDRNHQDKCWEKAFNKGLGTIIDKKEIEKEYSIK